MSDNILILNLQEELTRVSEILWPLHRYPLVTISQILTHIAINNCYALIGSQLGIYCMNAWMKKLIKKQTSRVYLLVWLYEWTQKEKEKKRTKTPNPRVLSTPLVGINGAAGGGKANKAGPMTCLVPRWNNQSGKQSSMESLEEHNSCMVELMKHEERKGGEGRAGLPCLGHREPP